MSLTSGWIAPFTNGQSVGLAIMLVVQLLDIPWDKVNWGDAPSWVNALVTAFALSAAVVAARASWHILKIERDRDEDRAKAEDAARKQAERAMADLVAVWHEALDTPLLGGVKVRNWAGVVTNDNPLPIYDVMVSFYGPDDRRRADVMSKVVPPGRMPFHWPGELRQQADQDANGKPIFTESPGDFSVGVRFRDVAGRCWHRDKRGFLWLTAQQEMPGQPDEGEGSPRFIAYLEEIEGSARV